jgi:hypothetical protein
MAAVSCVATSTTTQKIIPDETLLKSLCDLQDIVRAEEHHTG